MKILHVIVCMKKVAGTSLFAGEVCNSFAGMGYNVTVAVRNPDENNVWSLDVNVQLVSIESIVKSQCLINRFELVHIHGLWSFELHKIVVLARRDNLPIVWSTHGMTAPWAMKHKWWKKCLPWYLYQKHDLKSAALIHCTAENEAKWNNDLGFKNTFIAPLGTILPKEEVGVKGGLRCFTILFVGRIYPVKGLVNLIKAVARLPRDGWQLRIVGPDQAGHKAGLEKLVAKNELDKYVVFTGPKYGEDLSSEYDNCDIFVLPSYTENFGGVIIDALAHSKPVITTKGTPWNELKNIDEGKNNEGGCAGWWIDIGVEPLASALKEAFVLHSTPNDSTLLQMGQNGRKLVEEKYTWKTVCEKMISGYKEVLNGNA